ncbi:hypothetical protein AB0H43_01970 [Hamadaea sp. NPDC050747]|uniref:hypothetical protein n=1 Tax=Hamadaea sp. NPDC050747 TaxID=3155789 RepID=UPI0033F4C6AF
MPRRRNHSQVAKYFDEQYGIARRDQLVGSFVTDAELRWRLETREWRTVLPSVYALFRGDLALTQRASAGLLYGGPTSQLTGAVALTLWGLRYAPPAERVTLLVPTIKRVSSSPGFRIIRSDRLPSGPTEIAGLRVAPVARAVADAARDLIDLRTTRAMVTEAVQRQFASLAELTVELTEGPRRGSADLRRAIADVAGGARSAPEAELRDLCRTSRILPPVLWNPTLADVDGVRLPTPDGWIDDAGLAIEVDSKEFHASPELWAKTLHRHNQLTAAGVVVLHVTPGDIRRDPGAVLRLIEATYLDLLLAGRPHRARLIP